MTLTLEVNETTGDKTARVGPFMVTPPIDEDYWLFRVRLSDRQSIVGFPKFSTIGIGFAQEEDWNTNLPYTCGTEEIYEHVEHNKGDDGISREDCIAAIALVQEAAARYKQGDVGGTHPMTQAIVRSGYAEPNYIDRIAEVIAIEAGGELSDYWAPLFRMYAVLALAKGAAVTARDVHDAWSAWCAGVDPEHRSLKPFDQLTPEVQALDEPYVEAIVAASLHLEPARP